MPLFKFAIVVAWAWTIYQLAKADHDWRRNNSQ